MPNTITATLNGGGGGNMFKLFLAFMLLAFGAPLDGGAAMLLAARESFAIARAKRWTNPYVADGLIAMWDAVWNAGGGVHDPNATTWVDLVRGATASIADATVHDSYVSIPRYKTVVLSSPALGIDAGSLEILTSAYNVTRSVTFLNGSSFQRYIAARDSSTTTSSRLIINAPYGTGSTTAYNYGSTAYYNLANVHLFAMCGKYATSGTSRGFWVDNQAIGFSPYGPASKTRSTNATLGGEQNVRCVRIYNRTLTAAERAAHYAVDKERFNLS